MSLTLGVNSTCQLQAHVCNILDIKAAQVLHIKSEPFDVRYYKNKRSK